MSTLLQKLAALDPTTIQFQCDRYESAEQFQHMILTAACGAIRKDEITDWVTMIGELCIEDGGDRYTIPCLGGEYLSVWKELVEEYGPDHTTGTGTHEYFGEGFSIIRR